MYFYDLFPKKTKNIKGAYLQIYDLERGHTAHKSFKPIRYVHELQAKRINNPISYFKKEVNQLNQKFQATKNTKKALQISNESPEKLIRYFQFKNINVQPSVKKYIDSI